MIVVDNLSGLSEVYLGDDSISEVYVGGNNVWTKDGGEDMNYIFKVTYIDGETEVITKDCDGVTTFVNRDDIINYIKINKPLANIQKITDVKIGDCTTTLGGDAFNHFINCKKVVYGKNVTSIGEYQFWSSQDIALENITVLASTPPTLASKAFQYKSNTNYSGAIYVPSQSVNTYKTATNWSAFASQIQPIP